MTATAILNQLAANLSANIDTELANSGLDHTDKQYVLRVLKDLLPGKLDTSPPTLVLNPSDPRIPELMDQGWINVLPATKLDNGTEQPQTILKRG